MNTLSIEISSIKLLTGSGADEVIITSNNLKNGQYPFDGGQDIRIKIAAGKGMRWINDNLGTDIFNITEIVEV